MYYSRFELEETSCVKVNIEGFVKFCGLLSLKVFFSFVLFDFSTKFLVSYFDNVFLYDINPSFFGFSKNTVTDIKIHPRGGGT